MTTVTGKSRPGSIVAQAYALMAAADRADKKAANAKEPALAPAKPAAPAKKAAKKPARKKGGRK